jgi:hypothetical protein
MIKELRNRIALLEAKEAEISSHPDDGAASAGDLNSLPLQELRRRFGDLMIHPSSRIG